MEESEVRGPPGSMKLGYQPLIATDSFPESISMGQMLLCAAIAIFNEVDGEMNMPREKVLFGPTAGCNKQLKLLHIGAGAWSYSETFFAMSMSMGACLAINAEKVGDDE